MIKMSQERIDELLDIEARMNALEVGGVHKWEWYSESLEPYFKEKEQLEKIRESFDEIMEILSASAYEVSERGAGVAFAEEAKKEAFDELSKLVKEYDKETP